MIEKPQRRLAAIVAVDVVGYSRMMGSDEIGTLAAFRNHRSELIDRSIDEYGGRIVKTMGDGLLLEFPSVVDAVRCSIVVQEGMAERNSNVPESDQIILRIGVNQGDIIIEGDDIHGDGVNVAARLEALSEPGGICMASRVHDDVRDRLEANFVDGGEHLLKNISRPVKVWRWSQTGSGPTAFETLNKSGSLSLPDRPSIAVLPFDNMSADPEQVFFAEGIAEDIITELSRFSELFVIARNSSFMFKDVEMDVREIGSKLGVRYLLEGSIRKAGNRIRVNAQLIDATTSEHIWADRYDREIVDIFDIQDDLTRSIVTTIKGRVDVDLARYASAKPTNNLSAYECVLKGQFLVHKYNEEDFAAARKLLQDAIALDPNYARAYGWLAYVDAHDWLYWQMSTENMSHAVKIAEQGLALDDNDSRCHLALGVSFLFKTEYEKAKHHFLKASLLNPNDDLVMVEFGRYKMYTDDPLDGADLVRQGMRQNPFHPNWYWNVLARCLHTAKDFEGAISALEQIETIPFWSHAYFAACYTALGQNQKATEHVGMALQLKPDFTLKKFETIFPYRNSKVRKEFFLDFQKAGFPE